MIPILDRFRRGETITLIDKLATVTSLDELNGMCAELSARGQQLSQAESRSIALRRAELQKGAR